MKRAVVIGSGMGGLTSAILLARAGWDVTVLEQHDRAGGFLHRFFRDGVGYDTGFHYVGGARPDQLFGRAMAHLGVYDALRWEQLDPDGFDILRFPGFELRVPEGVDAFRDRLVGAFPHERAGIDRYISLHRAAVASYGWFNMELVTPPEAILPWEQRTVASVLSECFRDPRLHAVVAGQAALYGVPADDAPFGVHAVVTDHFLQGAWSIEGGGDRLALALVRRLRALGGRIHLKTRVSTIDLAGGAVSGVIAVDGRRFDADLVIANLHPRNVLGLLPAGAVRPAYATRVRETKLGRTFFGAYYRMEGDLSVIGNRNLYRFNTWDTAVANASATPDDIPFYFLTTPGHRGDPSRTVSSSARSAAGRDVALAIALTSPAHFAEGAGPNGRTPGYTDAKQRLLDGMTAAILADHPGWRVVSAEASTPLTTEDYTLSPEGAAYGHYHSVAQMGRYRLPMVTKVRGLLQVGQCVGFPGICGAMMSAYVGCAEILGSESLMRELRGE